MATNTSTAPLYGCMWLGGAWDAEGFGAAEVAHAEAAIEAALEIGITAFDHADIYGNGKAEAVFGEVLVRSAGLRERILIQTKCGILLGSAHQPGRYDLSAAHILSSVAKSLDRLRVDSIDVLLLHRPDPLADPDEIASALSSLRQQGMVGQFGVSNMSGEQIAHLQAHLDMPLVANQLEMSLHRRDWLEAGVLVNTTDAADNGFPLGTIEHCVSHGIGLQAWGALAQGRFTGGQQTSADQATARLVTSLAEEHGTTPESIVLWWLQRHPAGIAPVIGTTDPGRIRSCRDAVSQAPQLSREEWYRLWVTARGERLP
ncbi:MAG: aldo/keto reductase [Propionicimonas sp.]